MKRPAGIVACGSHYLRSYSHSIVEAGFVESWGRGFKKIHEEFEKYGLPIPSVEETGGGVMVRIQRLTMDEIISRRDKQEQENVGGHGAHILSERQILISSLIKTNPKVSAKQMSEVLSVTTRTIERDLSIMQKAGIIRREGNVKTGIWVILSDK